VKALVALTAVAACAVCVTHAAAQEPFALERGKGGVKFRRTANPSEVVATEIAFARAAQEKGQWTAFREYAADDAIMFVPKPVAAKDWLKGRANPPRAVAWQPYSIWMSCDGSMAVSKGAWQRADGSTGYFTTVWRRQKDGSYKWELDQGDALAQPLAAPEMIAGDVADCSTAKPPAIPPAQAGADQRVGWSDDKTLQWIFVAQPDGSRWLKAHRWTGQGYEEVLRSEVAAEK
jgi:hypothetical protein